MFKEINNYPKILFQETGFVLVVSLMLMVLLGVLGMIAQHAGTMEMRIASNEKFYKMAFFEANGSAELAISFLEMNLACGEEPGTILNESIMTREFWLNDRGQKVFMPLTQEEMIAMPGEPAEQEIPDLVIPGHGDGQTSGTHTLITIAGESIIASGGAIQMANGYEGTARSAANHGAYLIYDITARHIGLSASEATVHQQWRHVLGTEGECIE